MFPNVRMIYKVIILFAFFATISCTTFLDEILKIYVEKCKGKNTDLDPLELKKCGEIPFTTDNDTSVEKVRCVVAKNVIFDICNGTNENIKFNDGITGMKEFTNATNFCERSSRIPVNDKAPTSFAYFMQILSNSRTCDSFCTDLTDRTIPICSFFAAISYHKLPSEVRPRESVNPMKTKPQPSDALSTGSITNRKPDQTLDKSQVPNQPLNKNLNSDESNYEPPPFPEVKKGPLNETINEDSDSHKIEDKPSFPEEKNDAADQLVNKDTNSHKTKDTKPPSTGLKKKYPNDLKNGNVLDSKRLVPPTLSSSFNDIGEHDINPVDGEPYPDSNDQTPKKTDIDIDNQPIITHETKKGMIPKPSDYPFVNSEDSHFFYYFIAIAALCIFFYVGIYNKKKILALVIEGRRSNVKRRPNSAAYSKLDCNLEEAMTSGPSTSSSNTLLY